MTCECAYCGATFEPARKNQRFCQTPCRQAYHAEKREQGGTLVTVKSVTALKSGGLSVVIRPEGDLPGLSAGDVAVIRRIQ